MSRIPARRPKYLRERGRRSVAEPVGRLLSRCVGRAIAQRPLGKAMLIRFFQPALWYSPAARGCLLSCAHRGCRGRTEVLTRPSRRRAGWSTPAILRHPPACGAAAICMSALTGETICRRLVPLAPASRPYKGPFPTVVSNSINRTRRVAMTAVLRIGEGV